MPRHLLEIDDLNSTELNKVLSLSTQSSEELLLGKGAALLFEAAAIFFPPLPTTAASEGITALATACPSLLLNETSTFAFSAEFRRHCLRALRVAVLRFDDEGPDASVVAVDRR